MIASKLGSIIYNRNKNNDLKLNIEKINSLINEKRSLDTIKRTPYFCAGCPHNTSTQIPSGSRAITGISCAYLVQNMERNNQGFAQMGSEGATWVGESLFSNKDHVFQNLGDGTYIVLTCSEYHYQSVTNIIKKAIKFLSLNYLCNEILEKSTTKWRQIFKLSKKTIWKNLFLSEYENEPLPSVKGSINECITMGGSKKKSKKIKKKNKKILKSRKKLKTNNFNRVSRAKIKILK